MKDTTTNTIFNIYLLYPIDRDDEGNLYRLLKTYTNIGIELQAYLLDWEKMDYIDENIPFPKSYLYIPADHELFVHRAYKDKLLTKEEIDFISCKIIKECDLLIYFGNGYESHRVKRELECVSGAGIPVYTMPDLNPMSIQALQLAIKLIIKSRD